MVTLFARAASGSQFSGWSGGGCGGTSTCVVTVGGPVAITANFTVVQVNNDSNSGRRGGGGGSLDFLMLIGLLFVFLAPYSWLSNCRSSPS